MKCWRVSSHLLQAILVCFLDDRQSLVYFQLESLSPQSSSSTNSVGSSPVLQVFVAWACTLKLPLHQVEDWKRQNCQNVPPAGTQCRQMGANWCGSSKPGLIPLCRRHLRRCKTSTDLLPLHSCFIVIRHVTNNIYHSSCWQVMTQETSAPSFLENRDYYQIFLPTR